MAQQTTETGIGRALRRARVQLGKTLDDASRETRVRPDYLDALEHEAWGALQGDVYVRGFLRSYSRYLGLNPDKVVWVYERSANQPKPAPAPVERSPGVAPNEVIVLTGGNRRPSWILAAVATAIVLAAAAGIGLFNQAASVPEPAGDAAPPQSAEPPPPVVVDLMARGPVDIEVVPDDDPPIRAHLEKGDARSFQADERIVVRLSRGGRVALAVNDEDLGTPGVKDQPFEATYLSTHFRGNSSPSDASP